MAVQTMVVLYKLPSHARSNGRILRGTDPPAAQNTGQTLVKHWSNTGQTPVKHWSNTDRILRGTDPPAAQSPVRLWSSSALVHRVPLILDPQQLSLARTVAQAPRNGLAKSGGAA
jgi:hypothetical protein